MEGTEMRSVIVKEPGQLNIASRPVPVPGSHEVRVKIAFAGICGSDVHIYQGHNPFAKYPRVIGHEFFGIVDASASRSLRRVLANASRSIRWSAAAIVIPARLVGRMFARSSRSSGCTAMGDSATMPACRPKMPGAFRRLSAIVRRQWLSLLLLRQILPPSCSPRRRISPWFTALAQWA